MFLKNTVMECEACSELNSRAGLALIVSGDASVCLRKLMVDGSVFRYGGDGAPPLLRAQPLPPRSEVLGDASGCAVWAVS